VARAGRESERSSAPTIRDVATAAQVSRQTVSNVLNAPERVHPRTRERVLVAVERLGYHPHRGARNLKARASRLLGYRVPPTDAGGSNPVLDRFLHGLSDASRRAGYHVLLFTPDPDEDEIEAYDHLGRTTTVDGFVLSGVGYGDERIPFLLDRGVPFVAFGRSDVDRRYPWVDVDGAAGVATAVRHLVERGHRRVAYVGWPAGSMAGDQRHRGYREGLAAAGLEHRLDLEARVVDETRAAAEATSGLLGHDLPPTAVVTSSDVIAAGVIEAGRARGLRIGHELAVVGFDDAPVASYLSPPLTTLRQPLEEVGRRILELFTRELAGDRDDPGGVLVRPDLVVRESA
jgi:DNA-binding LacI/PurR family transcriptional regulator